MIVHREQLLTDLFDVLVHLGGIQESAGSVPLDQVMLTLRIFCDWFLRLFKLLRLIRQEDHMPILKYN